MPLTSWRRVRPAEMPAIAVRTRSATIDRLGAAPGDEDGELLAAEAGGDVGVALLAGEHCPTPASSRFPAAVAVAVVERLEPVEVEQHERDAAAVAAHAGDLGAKRLGEVVVVAKARQAVGEAPRAQRAAGAAVPLVELPGDQRGVTIRRRAPAPGPARRGTTAARHHPPSRRPRRRARRARAPPGRSEGGSTPGGRAHDDAPAQETAGHGSLVAAWREPDRGRGRRPRAVGSALARPELEPAGGRSASRCGLLGSRRRSPPPPRPRRSAPDRRDPSRCLELPGVGVEVGLAPLQRCLLLAQPPLLELQLALALAEGACSSSRAPSLPSPRSRSPLRPPSSAAARTARSSSSRAAFSRSSISAIRRWITARSRSTASSASRSAARCASSSASIRSARDDQPGEVGLALVQLRLAHLHVVEALVELALALVQRVLAPVEPALAPLDVALGRRHARLALAQVGGEPVDLDLGALLGLGDRALGLGVEALGVALEALGRDPRRRDLGLVVGDLLGAQVDLLDPGVDPLEPALHLGKLGQALVGVGALGDQPLALGRGHLGRLLGADALLVELGQLRPRATPSSCARPASASSRAARSDALRPATAAAACSTSTSLASTCASACSRSARAASRSSASAARRSASACTAETRSCTSSTMVERSSTAASASRSAAWPAASSSSERARSASLAAMSASFADASAASAVAAASRSAAAVVACSRRCSAASISSERCIMSARTASTESSFWVSTFSTFFARCSRSSSSASRAFRRVSCSASSADPKAPRSRSCSTSPSRSRSTCWRWRCSCSTCCCSVVVSSCSSAMRAVTAASMSTSAGAESHSAGSALALGERLLARVELGRAAVEVGLELLEVRAIGVAAAARVRRGDALAHGDGGLALGELALAPGEPRLALGEDDLRLLLERRLLALEAFLGLPQRASADPPSRGGARWGCLRFRASGRRHSCACTSPGWSERAVGGSKPSAGRSAGRRRIRRTCIGGRTPWLECPCGVGDVKMLTAESPRLPLWPGPCAAPLDDGGERPSCRGAAEKLSAWLDSRCLRLDDPETGANQTWPKCR